MRQLVGYNWATFTHLPPETHVTYLDRMAVGTPPAKLELVQHTKDNEDGDHLLAVHLNKPKTK